MFDFKDAGYNATLKDGKKIRIDNWPLDIALGNLTLASRVMGSGNILEISKLNTKATIIAITNAQDHKEAADLICHFCTCAVIEGTRIERDKLDTIFEGNLHLAVELFTHVIHSQYFDFFEYGLAKEPSQETSTTTKQEA